MAIDAVVLTYLEWDRLVRDSYLRMPRSRVVRVAGWTEPLAEADFDALMETAPDVGLSETNYVIAELKFEAWSPISANDFSLGRTLQLTQVLRFLALNEIAQRVLTATHSYPKEYPIQLFEPPKLWTGWLERISQAYSKNRGLRLLANLDNQNFSVQSEDTAALFEKLQEARQTLSGQGKYEKSKGTRAFGWVTALAIAKKMFNTQASSAVRASVDKLSNDFGVGESFFHAQSADIANEVLADPQYKKACSVIVFYAAYVHYAYLMQRSDYKIFGYDAFLKDFEWLRNKDTNLAAQLVYKTACDMSDELLSRVLSQHPKSSFTKSSQVLEDNSLVTSAISSTTTSKASDTSVDSGESIAAGTTLVLPSNSLVDNSISKQDNSTVDIDRDCATAAADGGNPSVASSLTGANDMTEEISNGSRTDSRVTGNPDTEPVTTDADASEAGKMHGKDSVGITATCANQEPCAGFNWKSGDQRTLLSCPADLLPEDIEKSQITGTEHIASSPQIKTPDRRSGKAGKPDGVKNAMYRDPETGKEWSGVGKTPSWIKDQDRSKFLITQ